MKLSDIVALAKSGYKVSEIKELLALEEKQDEKPEENPDEKPEEKSEEKPDDKPEEKDEKVDYKAKYEALLEENRKRAARTDLSGKEDNKTPEDIVNEALRDLL